MGRTVYISRFSSPKPEDHQLADQALKTLGILHLREKIYTQISGGERQLVLIARALCQGAQILILDEPASNLDFGNQAKVYGHLRALSKKGYIVILSSHIPNDALQYASHVMLMNHGTVSTVDAPEKLITSKSIKSLYEINAEIIDIKSYNKSLKICVPSGT
jgi:ABC-type cobalamin/Fe3+-siderophores transport system ATPase subunit